jgi:hypothetical protein
MVKSRVFKFQVLAALVARNFIMWVLPPAWTWFKRGGCGYPQDYVDVVASKDRVKFHGID